MVPINKYCQNICLKTCKSFNCRIDVINVIAQISNIISYSFLAHINRVHKHNITLYYIIIITLIYGGLS